MEEQVALAEMQLTLDGRALELIYERICRHVDLICDAEESRQLRVQALLLEDENDNLHAQLSQDDDRVDDLERCNQVLQEDLYSCSGRLESAQGDLRIKLREIETLKAELNSLHGVTMDSTRILAEKLTLARELSSLKPELDHLRSQTATHQSLLAEKLSLQRQLSTVQVELETEKRSMQRVLATEDKLQAEDAKLESRLESLQANLAKEHRERQKVEREAQKLSREAENKRTTLESRLDAFRNKLKTTKEQLKETQTALLTAQASANAVSNRTSASNRPTTASAPNHRKRVAVQMDADTMIGTPGDMPASKRSKGGSTLPGEKSTFSITPFLNRTASVAPDSPPLEYPSSDSEENEEKSHRVTVGNKLKAAAVGTAPESRMESDLSKRGAQGKKPGVLENANTSKINSRAPPARKPKAAPTLEKVAEEGNNENVTVAPTLHEPTTNQHVSDDTINEGADMKKRKRKLLGGGLGKTLFDEDEGDALKGSRGLLGGVRGFGTLARVGLGRMDFGPRKAVGATNVTFGTISPLKKDMKRVPP